MCPTSRQEGAFSTSKRRPPKSPERRLILDFRPVLKDFSRLKKGVFKSSLRVFP